MEDDYGFDVDLLVPWAWDTNGLRITPEEAGSRQQYRCPDCDGPVQKRSRAGVRTHFYHIRLADAKTCEATGGGESATHRRAKRQLEGFLSKKLGQPRPVLSVQHKCCVCRTRLRQKVELPRFDAVRIEFSSPETGGFRHDVALLRGGIPIFAIEVCVSNPVLEDRARDFWVPWIELGLTSVNRRQSRQTFSWIGGSPKAPPPTKCAKCRESRELVLQTGNFPWLKVVAAPKPGDVRSNPFDKVVATSPHARLGSLWLKDLDRATEVLIKNKLEPARLIGTLTLSPDEARWLSDTLADCLARWKGEYNLDDRQIRRLCQESAAWRWRVGWRSSNP